MTITPFRWLKNSNDLGNVARSGLSSRLSWTFFSNFGLSLLAFLALQNKLKPIFLLLHSTNFRIALVYDNISQRIFSTHHHSGEACFVYLLQLNSSCLTSWTPHFLRSVSPTCLLSPTAKPSPRALMRWKERRYVKSFFNTRAAVYVKLISHLLLFTLRLIFIEA